MAGVRKEYYSDREDAIIRTAFPDFLKVRKKITFEIKKFTKNIFFF